MNEAELKARMEEVGRKMTAKPKDSDETTLAAATGEPEGDGRENGQNRTLSMRPVRLRP